VDAIAVVFIALGLLALRRVRPPVVRDAREAFQILDRTIERFVPELPAGFTWGEAMLRLKGSGVEADCPKMEHSLAEYEAFRYGGRAMPPGKGEEAVRLSTQIRRKIVGYRNKGKGTGGNR
jgi:hypothetical protein